MIKVKMVSRHTAGSKKLERGLSYLLPQSYAQELIDHGLAILGVPDIPTSPPVNVTMEPTKTIAMATALKEVRAKGKKVIEMAKNQMEVKNGPEKST